MKNLTIPAALLLMLICVGCAVPGSMSDRALFNFQTNYTPHVIMVTNTIERTNVVETPIVIKEVVVVTNTVLIPVLVTNVQREVVVVTNVIGGQTITVTNTIERQFVVTNIVQGDPIVVERIVERTNIVLVPQLSSITNVVFVTNQEPHDVEVKLKPGIAQSIGIGGALGGPWGQFAGAAVVALFGALAAARQKVINAQLAGANAQQAVDLNHKTTVIGVLAQSVEVGRELIKTTPLGQALDEKYRQWLVHNQSAAQVIGTVTQIVDKVVDNQQAREVAQLLAPEPTADRAATDPTKS